MEKVINFQSFQEKNYGETIVKKLLMNVVFNSKVKTCVLIKYSILIPI